LPQDTGAELQSGSIGSADDVSGTKILGMVLVLNTIAVGLPNSSLFISAAPVSGQSQVLALLERPWYDIFYPNYGGLDSFFMSFVQISLQCI
jgi:hypothetical protein